MGFGSYDETDQTDPHKSDESNGESVTKEFKQNEHRGEETTEDQSTEEMVEHL